MSDTKAQIAALKAHAENLKEPLRKRYWEIEAARKPKLDALQALQAERDANIDDLTQAQLRDYDARIKAARAGIDGPLEEERKDILRALRDEDGKTRLGSP